MKKFYLYKIVNSVNEKVYIGITSRPDERFKQHLDERSNCRKLKHAINKHGSDKFKMEILCIGNEDYILELEYKAILAYDSINSGYNLVLGNPRTGGASLSEETKVKISEGLNKWYAENIAWNSGIVIGRRIEYDPVYVTGFWFNHPQDAIATLNLNIKTFRRWKKDGTLGDVQHLSKDSVSDLPVYVGGFWFDTYIRASDKLDQKIPTLKKRVKEGYVEQKNNKVFKTGKDNHMTGRKGLLHHRSKPVIVDDQLYGSISQASELTEFTKKMIYTRIKNNIPGFAWATEETKQWPIQELAITHQMIS